MAAAWAALAGCHTPPKACLSYLPELKPMGFEEAVVRGREDPGLWAGRLRAAIAADLGLERVVAPSGPPAWRERPAEAMPGRRGAGVLEIPLAVRSAADGREIPASIFVRAQPPPLGDVVLLLHGHANRGDKVLGRDTRLRGAAAELARAGRVVVAPQTRSFGDFIVDGKDHEAYARGLGDGAFLREALADALTMVEFAKARFPKRSSLTLAGHSLGGYIALHAGALSPDVDKVVVSGIFLPYSCLHTEEHHRCQHSRALRERAEIADVAGLVAPRPLVIEFGSRDPYLTGSAREAAARAKGIYGSLGRPEAVTFIVTPGAGHRASAARIAAFILGPSAR